MAHNEIMEVDYSTYLPPPNRTFWEKFRRCMYNPDTDAVLGRTGKSWAGILLFYLIFFSALISMFCGFGAVFFQTLDPRIPKWQLGESLIGTSPGLGYRPMPPRENVESVLIWYKGNDAQNYKYWTDSLNEFLEDYQKPGTTAGLGQNIHMCDFESPPSDGQVCDVDIKNFGPCKQENMFGYDRAAPCIFIKLNRIYNWIPEFLNDTNNLPESMPAELKAHIIMQEKLNPKSVNTVWVSCAGEFPADRENLGPIDYFPGMGFPGYFYPYKNAEGYLSPLVAVQFNGVKTGVLIHIECKAWAGNIKHDRPFKAGSLHIELQID